MIQTRLAGRSWLVVLGMVILSGIVVGSLWIFRPNPPEVSLQVTQAYRTVAAQLTEASQSTPVPSDTSTPISTDPTQTTIGLRETPTMQVVSPTLSQDQTVQDPSNTPTPNCDRAAAGNPIDVTVTDETEFRPGQSFTKIWRLENIGSCPWISSYAAQFFYGDRMGAPETVFLGREVAPGQVVEIAVDLVAPSEPGTYQGNWKLRNADGFLFGIGPKGDAPFWVRIVVIRVATPTFTPTVTPTVTQTPTLVMTATPTATSTPLVESSGSLIIQPAQTVDLDSGQQDTAAGQDLAYLLDTGYHLLAPQSGAILGVYGILEPGLLVCETAGMSPVPIALESLSPGTYLCYRTDENRLGWLRYDSLDDGDDTAKLVFRTWANP